MEFTHLFVLALFFLAIVGINGSKSGEDYWKSVWPNTPMPKSLSDLLLPESGTSVPIKGQEEKQYWTVFFEHDLYPGKKMSLGVHKHSDVQPSRSKAQEPFKKASQFSRTRKWLEKTTGKADQPFGTKIWLEQEESAKQPFGTKIWLEQEEGEKQPFGTKIWLEQEGEKQPFGTKIWLENEETEKQPFGTKIWLEQEESEKQPFGTKIWLENEESEKQPFGTKIWLENEESEKQPFGTKIWLEQEESEKQPFGTKIWLEQEESEKQPFGTKIWLEQEETEKQPFGTKIWLEQEESEKQHFGTKIWLEQEESEKKPFGTHISTHDKPTEEEMEKSNDVIGISAGTGKVSQSFRTRISIDNAAKKETEKTSQISVAHTLDEKETHILHSYCENPSAVGEEKHCAQSLQSMMDFAISKLGKNIKVMSSSFSQNQDQYVVEEVKKIGDNAVMCHRLNFKKVVFYCHQVNATTTYMVPLVASDGTKSKALTICHHDTRGMDPNVLYDVLKVKPGTVPVCHFIGNKAVAWVPNDDVIDSDGHPSVI